MRSIAALLKDSSHTELLSEVKFMIDSKIELSWRKKISRAPTCSPFASATRRYSRCFLMPTFLALERCKFFLITSNADFSGSSLTRASSTTLNLLKMLLPNFCK